MSKEQTPITAEGFYYKWQTQDFEPKKIEMPNFTEEELLNFGEQYAQAKALEAQNNLIADIKDKVAKLEENTNTTDFAFDVVNLLKSIKPLTNEKKNS